MAEMTVDHLFEQQFESELVLHPGLENGKKMRLLMEKEKAEMLAKKKKIRIHFPGGGIASSTGVEIVES